MTAGAPDTLTRDQRRRTVLEMVRRVADQEAQSVVLRAMLDLPDDAPARVLRSGEEGLVYPAIEGVTVGERVSGLQGSLSRISKTFKEFVPPVVLKDAREEAVTDVLLLVLRDVQQRAFVARVEREANGAEDDDPCPGVEHLSVREHREALESYERRLIEAFTDRIPDVEARLASDPIAE